MAVGLEVLTRAGPSKTESRIAREPLGGPPKVRYTCGLITVEN